MSRNGALDSADRDVGVGAKSGEGGKEGLIVAKPVCLLSLPT